jgi:hypothetical protein
MGKSTSETSKKRGRGRPATGQDPTTSIRLPRKNGHQSTPGLSSKTASHHARSNPTHDRPGPRREAEALTATVPRASIQLGTEAEAVIRWVHLAQTRFADQTAGLDALRPELFIELCPRMTTEKNLLTAM